MSDLLLCRICAKTQTKNLRRLFDKRYTQLVKEIKKLAGVTLKCSTNLPQFICQNCFKDLKRAIEFRMRLLSSHYYFTTTQYLEKLEVTRKNHKKNAETNKSNIEIKVEHEVQRIVPSNLELKVHTSSDEEEATQDCDLVAVEHSKSRNETAESVSESASEMLTEEAEKRKYTQTQNMICDICGKIFKNRIYLMRHFKRHGNQKQLACEFCDYKSFRKSALNIHTRKHTDEEQFSCNYCDKKFSSRRNVRRHKRANENLGLYACKYCDETFTANCMLKVHVNSHTVRFTRLN